MCSNPDIKIIYFLTYLPILHIKTLQNFIFLCINANLYNEIQKIYFNEIKHNKIIYLKIKLTVLTLTLLPTVYPILTSFYLIILFIHCGLIVTGTL